MPEAAGVAAADERPVRPEPAPDVRVPMLALTSFFSRGRFENKLRKLENNIGTQL